VEWLGLVPLIVLLVMFSTGVTMLLSALYVRYRDMQPIWEVVLQMLFYASPVIYVTSTFPDSIEQEAMANPITAILTQARHWLIDPEAPTAADAIGGAVWLLVPLFVVVFLFALGLWVFMREAPRIAEEL
jgi:ABC-2 type transport system permease protein